MRVLLDECMPRPIRRAFTGHEVRTVAEMGWSGKENGELLALIVESNFGALIKVDRNLRYQQNIRAVGIAILVLIAPSNRMEDLLPLAPAVLRVLANIQPGQLFEIDH